MRHLAVAFALMLLAVIPPSFSTDMPPVVHVVGKYSTVSMFFDDRLSLPGLAEHFRQETRDWARTVEAAEMARASAPPDQLPHFSRRYDVGSIVDRRYYSVLRRSTDFDAVDELDTLLWDGDTDTRTTPAVFFKEFADEGATMKMLLELVKAGLDEKLARWPGAVAVRQPEPSLSGIGPISLASSTMRGKSAGLNFHYPISVPGRFARKQAVVFVPWRKFSHYLSRRGRAIFAGAWKEKEMYESK